MRELQEKVDELAKQIEDESTKFGEFRSKWLIHPKTGEPEDVFRRMNSMIDFLYSWVKGAEAAGVFKLPPKCF